MKTLPIQNKSIVVQSGEKERFLLRLPPSNNPMKTSFLVFTQQSSFEIISESSCNKLFAQMSEYKQKEVKENDGLKYKMICEQNLIEKENLSSHKQDITVCLLYHNESKQQLCRSQIIEQYKQHCKQFILLVNGYKSLHQDFDNLHQDFKEFEEQHTLMKWDSYELCYYQKAKIQIYLK